MYYGSESDVSRSDSDDCVYDVDDDVDESDNDDLPVYGPDTEDVAKIDAYYEREFAQEQAKTNANFTSAATLLSPYENIKRKEKEKYLARSDRLRRKGLKCYPRLTPCLKWLRERMHRGAPMHIFAFPKPRPDDASQKVKQVKEYWVGMHNKFWQYAQEEKNPVLFDECVLSSISMPLFFDVEIKQMEPDDVSNLHRRDWNKVFSCHLANVDDGVMFDERNIPSLVDMYKAVAVTEFTNEECKAGLCVVIDFLTGFLSDRLDMNCLFKIVSGCRSAKFSFHIVTKDLLVDSTVKSMPLLVFEIARAFQVHNLEAVINSYNVDNTQIEDLSHEIKFRIRALMIFGLVLFHDDDNDAPGPRVDGDGTTVNAFTFRVIDDSIFDEAVYSPNHLLRAPGACKASTGALHPVTVESVDMIREVRIFENVFPPDDTGWSLWEANLITGNVLDNVKCLVGMKPSNAYPRKKTWFSISNKIDSAGDYGYPTITYDERRMFVDRREFVRRSVTHRGEKGNLFRRITCAEIDEARETVMPDEMFKGEDLVRKPFRMFRSNEWLYHRHGDREENSASAKVFCGGFRCFGCNKTYVVPRETPFEELYMFRKIVSSDKPQAYMTDLPWHLMLPGKKMIVISAPMGSGKTEQLIKLTDYLDDAEPAATILVISFRELLAKQQASRMGILCYKDVSNEGLREGPKSIAICLNSIHKLPDTDTKVYDYIILDECGLIRRHFLSGTIRNVPQTYDYFQNYVRASKCLILLQDGISTEDVRFFSEMFSTPIDPYDETLIHSVEFKKPIEIHPIEWSMDYHAAVVNLIECYKKSIGDMQSDEGFRMCEHPFMVFCNSCKIAEYLVTILREEATKAKANPNAIQGIWSQIKEVSEFCQAFGCDPNEASSNIDVIVCTSVIGAGFSIDVRFEAFHAFFVSGILAFEEERQFIQRLRFLLKKIPENAIRQSYLFTEKGRGSMIDYSKVLSSFASVRRLAISLHAQRTGGSIHLVMENKALESTAARIEVERVTATSIHHTVWKDYGERMLQSDFVEANWSYSANQINDMKQRFADYIRKRKRDITGHLMQDDYDDLSACVSELEISETFDIMRLADIKAIGTEIDQHFKYPQAWLRMLDDKRDKVASTSFRRKVVSQTKGLIGWLSFLYVHLVPDRLTLTYSGWYDRRIDTHMLKRVAHIILAKSVIFPLLSVTEEAKKVSYLLSGGTYPFMCGARFVIDGTFVSLVKDQFEVGSNDDNATMETKSQRRNAYMVLMQCQNTSESCFVKLYDYLGETHEDNAKCMIKFVKAVFAKVGITVKATTARKTVNSHRHTVYATYPPMIAFKSALCLKSDMRDRLLELLPVLLDTENTSPHDKVWMNDCIDALHAIGIKVREGGQNMNILQRLAIVPQRIAENTATTNARPSPIIGFDIDDDNDNFIDNDLAAHPTTSALSSTHIEDSFFDDEEMNSVDNRPLLDQITTADAHLARVDECQQQRFLQFAATRKHGPAPVYRREVPHKRSKFIDDAAIEEEDDTQSQITQNTEVSYFHKATNTITPSSGASKRFATNMPLMFTPKNKRNNR